MADKDVHESTPAESVWYYEREGRQVGPFSRHELDQLKAAGIIDVDTPLTEVAKALESTGDGTVKQGEPERPKAKTADEGDRTANPTVNEQTKVIGTDDIPSPPPPPDAHLASGPAGQEPKKLKFGEAIGAAFCAMVGMGIAGKVMQATTGVQKNIPLAILMLVVIVGVAIFGFVHQNYLAATGASSEPRVNCPKCKGRFAPRDTCPFCGHDLTSR